VTCKGIYNIEGSPPPGKWIAKNTSKVTPQRTTSDQISRLRRYLDTAPAPFGQE
jgi:hypothetical protein